MTDSLPIGPPVPPGERRPPSRKTLNGQFVQLRALDPVQDAGPLFDASHGTPAHAAIWTYLPYGPFGSPAAMQEWLTAQAASDDPLFLAVVDQTAGRPVGMVSFQSIAPAMRRLELAHIWYGLEAQRSKINTEAIYLMLRETFDGLDYRRAEWKCDSLNARSRAAALRLGFRFEGIFRQHMIYKDRSRDTAWFAMMDFEWPAVKANMERWLYGGEAGLSLAALNRENA